MAKMLENYNEKIAHITADNEQQESIIGERNKDLVEI